MGLLFYTGMKDQMLLLRKYGYDSENEDSAESRRAHFIVDLILEEDRFYQTAFDMRIIFFGKLGQRKYRKKYEWIMRKAKARYDAAMQLLQIVGWKSTKEPSTRFSRNLGR